MVEFQVLGPLVVQRDGAPRPVPSRRQRALIARLLLGRGQMVPAAAIVDAVWETDPPRDARHALHTQISRVRQLLGPGMLVTRAPGYLLAAEPAAVDAERFEAGVTGLAAATSADAAAPAAVVARLDELLGLWHGPAYAEFAGAFAQAAAVRLEELRLTAREHRGAALLALGDLDRAMGELGELAADHPLREQPQELLMRALYLAGRQSEALEVFHRFRKRLGDELGLDPSPTLQRVHDQVLRREVPSPPPAAPVRLAVSRSVTSFVGRERELSLLCDLIDGNRMVSLVGPGGVGKTRLARELVNRLGDRTAWWVDLAPVRDPADVPYRLVDALGLPQPAERNVEAFVVDKLRSTPRGHRAVLVADNCEHVIAAAAEILGRIVASCPHVVVLATSREPLAVAGERVLPIAPLPEPAGRDDPRLPDSPAVALFQDRLRAAGAPELTAAEVPVVAEICRRVGGLPLAIELAAARARSLGLATLAERPTLDLLTGGPRGEPARHRSLRAVLDWSHDLLDTSERTLFRRLATFSGPFTLDDAERVCAGATLETGRLVESLVGLVDKSMVVGPERGHYRLLDPMRGYAVEQLAGHGEDRWLGAAHARHFVALAEQARSGLRTSAEGEWVGRLAGRVDELRVAHRWACVHDADLAVRLAAALAVYARYQMRFELQDWGAAAAALPGTAGHPLRAAALASAACGAWARGEFTHAERLAQAALAAAPEHDPVSAAPRLVLGDIALLAGRLADAERAYQLAARLAGIDDPHTTCEALGGQALVRCYQGDQDEALTLAAAGERLARDWGAPGLVAMARYFAGECRLASDPAGALELLEESRRLAAGAGALLVVGFATLSAVSVRARAGGGPAEVFAAYREAIEHWRRAGNRTQQWVTLRNLVPVLVRADQAELALVVHGALGSAPVQLPAGVVVPEARALAEAVAEARLRLGDQTARAAGERGARLSMDELLAAVLGTIAAAPDQAGSSR